MTSIDSLKKEVAILNKVLTVNDKPQHQNQIEKLLFYTEKLIELSRDPNQTEQAKLNREIVEFNAKHPFTANDVLRLEPYKEIIEKTGGSLF